MQIDNTIYGIIYSIKHRYSGMEYVGKTTKTLRIRIERHLIQARSSNGHNRFHNAIKKYGISAFDSSIICTGSSKEELNALERFHIKERRSLSPNGYNLTVGGDGGPQAPEAILRAVAKRRGRKHSALEIAHRAAANTGKKRTAETCQKISDSNRGKPRLNGRRPHGPMSEATKQALSKIFQGTTKSSQSWTTKRNEREEAPSTLGRMVRQNIKDKKIKI